MRRLKSPARELDRYERWNGLYLLLLCTSSHLRLTSVCQHVHARPPDRSHRPHCSASAAGSSAPTKPARREHPRDREFFFPSTHSLGIMLRPIFACSTFASFKTSVRTMDGLNMLLLRNSIPHSVCSLLTCILGINDAALLTLLDRALRTMLTLGSALSRVSCQFHCYPDERRGRLEC